MILNRFSSSSRQCGRPGRVARSRNSLRSRRRGAALLEFALVATMFLMLLMGMLQFGVYLSTTNSLWNLSREGARYASVQRAENDAKNDNNKLIIDHVSKSSPTGMLPPNVDPSKLTVTIEPSDAAARTKGSEVRITLSYDMRDKMFVPMAGMLPNSYKTTTSMMVE